MQQLDAQVDFAPVNAAADELADDLDGTLGQIQEEMEKLAEQASKLLATATARKLRERLADLAEQGRVLKERAEQVTDEAEAEAELGEPDVEDLGLSEMDWLLDTTRGYVEQLEAYRRHEPIHRRRPPLDLSLRPGCLECGGSMAGRPSKAKFCCDEHAARYNDRRRSRARRAG